jgi:hypothetical protein
MKTTSSNFGYKEGNQVKKQQRGWKSKSTKRRKSQSNYTNQFATHISPSIFVIVKKHNDLIGVFCYLKTFHRKLGKVSGLYENLRFMNGSHQKENSNHIWKQI